MEMEQRTPLMAKKLWGIIKAIMYMVKKGLPTNIPWFEIHTILKRSTKIGIQTLTCRPNDIHTTFIAPTSYQFSCSSNTPVFYPKRKHSRRSHKLTVNDVRKVFDVLNSYEVEPERSPVTLLGFGVSPNVRRLRVTDSPFPVDDTEEDTIQVDKAAEEFIKSFYDQLKMQKNRADVEPLSPLCYRKWGLVR